MSDRSFEAFVAERSTALLRTAYLLTGDHAEARDLVQTALIAVHRHGDALADPVAAARRELVRAATGWRRRMQVGHLLAESPLLAGTSGLPGFGTQARAEPGPRTELTAALSRLPARERAALVLHHGEALTEAATAEALEVSDEEVRDLLARALARLDSLLAEARAEARAEAGAEERAEAGAEAGTDGRTAGRLRAELAVRAADVAAAPEDTLAGVLEGARSRRGHLVGLAALAAFVVLVVLLVAVTV